ncbi:hypothetical protein, partial [Siminovitchia fortis]|uniref:hypothetical protein n=1 Tax=Siminovitchia fortis TaxID=254758 RepID=UPI001C95470B
KAMSSLVFSFIETSSFDQKDNRLSIAFYSTFSVHCFIGKIYVGTLYFFLTINMVELICP